MAISTEQFTINCTHCEKAVPAPNFDLHIAHCSRNFERCQVCEEMVLKRHVEEHCTITHSSEVCKKSRDYCCPCGRYIGLWERAFHGTRCHGSSKGIIGTSRDKNEPGKGKHAQRRPNSRDLSHKAMLFTVAIAGATILVGSILFRRKAEIQQVRQ